MLSTSLNPLNDQLIRNQHGVMKGFDQEHLLNAILSSAWHVIQHLHSVALACIIDTVISLCHLQFYWIWAISWNIMHSCVTWNVIEQLAVWLSRVWTREPWISRRARYPETTDSTCSYFGERGSNPFLRKIFQLAWSNGLAGIIFHLRLEGKKSIRMSCFLLVLIYVKLGVLV